MALVGQQIYQRSRTSGTMQDQAVVLSHARIVISEAVANSLGLMNRSAAQMCV